MAGHQARAVPLFMLHRAGLAFCHCRPLSSNVERLLLRQRDVRFWPIAAVCHGFAVHKRYASKSGE